MISQSCPWFKRSERQISFNSYALAALNPYFFVNSSITPWLSVSEMSRWVCYLQTPFSSIDQAHEQAIPIIKDDDDAIGVSVGRKRVHCSKARGQLRDWKLGDS